MEVKEFQQKLNELSQKINIQLEEKQINQFYTYMNLLLQWNEKINLTAITDPNEIILKHFIDSITIMSYLEKNKNIVDVGTGGGFPGIPVKIVNEKINMTLLDSLNKRINVLKEIINTLNLDNISAIHARVEEFGQNKENREKFDIATSRAVAKLNILSEYMLPLVKVGGKCICMKGPDIDEEIEESQKAIELLGGRIDEIKKFTLPESNLERTIIVISKIKRTANKYPRKPGMPAKEPIK